MVGLGLFAACVWGMSAVLGFQQFGLPTVVFGLALAYSGAGLYAVRTWQDRRLANEKGVRTSLHKKLTGAMLLVMTLDSVAYLIAVRFVDQRNPGLLGALEDIFVAVSLITISVGLILPGVIAHTATQVAAAADRLATGTLADFTRAMESFASGDLEGTSDRVDARHIAVGPAPSGGDLFELGPVGVGVPVEGVGEVALRSLPGTGMGPWCQEPVPVPGVSWVGPARGGPSSGGSR